VLPRRTNLTSDQSALRFDINPSMYTRKDGEQPKLLLSLFTTEPIPALTQFGHTFV
jgi:hypothetical protein